MFRKVIDRKEFEAAVNKEQKRIEMIDNQLMEELKSKPQLAASFAEVHKLRSEIEKRVNNEWNLKEDKADN